MYRSIKIMPPILTPFEYSPTPNLNIGGNKKALYHVLTTSSFSYVHPRKHLFRLGSIPLGSDAPKFSHRSFVAFGDAYTVSTPNQIRPTHFISRPSRFITPAEMTTSFHFVLILFLFTRLVRTSSFFRKKALPT